MHIAIRVIALVVLIATGVAGAGEAARAEMVSHRALYTLSLARAGTGSEIAELEGRMEYQVVRACDGWTSEQRMVMRFINGAGDEFLLDTRFAGEESLDGRHLRFEQQTRYNNEIIEELRGEATNGPEGGEVHYEKPEIMTRSLPAGILFPMRHAEHVIARARAGDMQIKAIIFEPSTLDSPYDASAVVTPLATLRELPGVTSEVESWMVRIAYFPLGSRDSSPMVEIGMALRADGIAPDFEWDYGRYAVKGELSAIELLAPVGC